MAPTSRGRERESGERSERRGWIEDGSFGKRRKEEENGETTRVKTETSNNAVDINDAPPVFQTIEEKEEAERIARIAERAEAKALERARATKAASSNGSSNEAHKDFSAHSNGRSNGASSSWNGEAAAGSRKRSRSIESASDDGARRRNGIEPLSLEELVARKKAEEEARTTLAVGKGKVAFKSKQEREAEAVRRLQEKRRASDAAASDSFANAAAERGMPNSMRQARAAASADNGSSRDRDFGDRDRARGRDRGGDRDRDRDRGRDADREQRDAERRDRAREKELELIRQQYLGGAKPKKRVTKPSEKFARIFQFDWDAGEDTSNDLNPLYKERARMNALFGRGYIAGIDMREQRKDSAFQMALVKKRNDERRALEEADDSLTREEKETRERRRRAEEAAALAAVHAAAAAAGGGGGGGGRDGGGDASGDIGLPGRRWDSKKLEEMQERDWRIFREDFDIHVKGGRAPMPLRYWREGDLPSGVIAAIEDLGYEHPTPIQRQTIPIGMERRDLIGIAETGSGKTAAFCIPMIAYIKALPERMLERIAEDGPLALIMAPTRELAQQIEEECRKFCRHCGLTTLSVVGGQSITEQGAAAQRGVHIVVGTPGRLDDCLENHYLVLNQCHYIVLDEADRMVDMGFLPQVKKVMEAMPGGSLKSEDERTAWEQEARAMKGDALYRVTSMFSATMPPEVLGIAKEYLRHPAIVQIGDEDTGKNRRIEQRVLSVPEAQKKARLAEILRLQGRDDKVIVFVNTKKSTDLLARWLDEQSFPNGALHGGKTQEMRELNLEDFRAGKFNILVATDVASRGLDIPDVAHVVNFELPNNIQTYCHRIGRTGRAGKDGLATSFMTGGENEKDILYDLKMYLTSTGAKVPEALATHADAQAAVGTRRDDGELVGKKRDTVKYSKR